MTNQSVYVENELFLGRLDEQDRFREVLRTVLSSRDEDGPPFIFLIYGEGGMGKSQLTRRLYDIVTTEAPFERDWSALRVDWELVRNSTPALRVARDQIHPEVVLDALHRAALDEGWGRQFKKYQEVVKQRRQAEQAVAQALEREREQSQYTAIRDLGAGGLAKLVRQVIPVVGQTGEDLSRALLAAGIQLGAEQVAKVRQQAEQFLKARLKPELYDVYRQPHEQLARALGDGFQRVSRDCPLVLLLDTYEIVAAAADTWLRQVIKAAGPRVVWVIAGRDNLAASRPGDRYVGYSAEFPRRLTTWDIQELAIEYVSAYLRDRAPERPPTSDEAAAIHRATLGVPLALRQAADLWAQGVALTAMTEGIPDYAPRETLVRLMCERVLMHVEQDAGGQADRCALYALAMQPRPDAGVQAAMLRPAGEDFDLSARLAELARRYSAVRLAGGARLHDAMGNFVSEYLLRTEAGAGDMVKDITGRAVETLRARRTELAADLFDLAEQVESEDWQQATLDLVHWLFWQDERAAWRELVPRFVEGLGYDPGLARSLLEVVDRFKPRLGKDGRRRLKRLQLDDDNRETMLAELERLAQKGRWLEDDQAEATAERHTILDLWRGSWLADQGQLDAALQSYLATERRLPAEAANLREQLAAAFSGIGWKLGWERRQAIPSPEAELALNKAVVLNKTEGYYWVGLGVMKYGLRKNIEAVETLRKGIELEGEEAYSLNWLGIVYRALGRHAEAIAAYQRAIELDPKDAYPHNALGNVYRDQGRHAEAIAACQQAIELDPKDAYPHNALGNVYSVQGRHAEAMAAYQRAIELDPKDAYPHTGLGTVYSDQGRHAEAIAAYQRAIELDPKYASPHASLALVLQKLGRETEAGQHLARARELMANETAYNKACIEAIAGNTEAALDYLAEALAQAPGMRAWARRDPDLASLRGQARFEELVGERGSLG